MFDPFVTFDQTPYRTAPQLPLQTLIILTLTLSSRVPTDPPAHVVAADEEMRSVAKLAAKAMVVRLRETNEIRLAGDLELDNGMDGLIVLLRDSLRGWQRYQKVGLDFLLEDPEFEVSFASTREKAELAASLLTRLFGDGNLNMLTRPYPEQAQLMSNVLDLIAEDELEKDIIAVTGDELLPIIIRTVAEYKKMVDRRAAGESASRTDLGIARVLLQRQIVNYCSMVLSMLSVAKPETRAVIETALYPMIHMRTVRSARDAADKIDPSKVDPDIAKAIALADEEADALGGVEAVDPGNG